MTATELTQPSEADADDMVGGNVGNHRRHILVVNDTQEILDLFRDILEEEGYRVSLYSYAINDLAQIKRIAPDLIILDFIIGGEDTGWQLLQKLKMDRQTMMIPVVVCTAALRLVQELEGHLRAKNVAVILKPFDIDDLITQVNVSLENLAVPPQGGI
ncbi:MAG: response regulator [Chloroflexota bacterium]|nr:response regulator [Chloroflexota bacterium]